jgi:hypothetical protein
MTRGRASVAVLMPTFEQASFIARALDSLLAQSHAHWELAIGASKEARGASSSSSMRAPTASSIARRRSRIGSPRSASAGIGRASCSTATSRSATGSQAHARATRTPRGSASGTVIT